MSQGSEGGGRVKLPKLNNGDPLIATAGAERSVHVLDVDRCSVVKRWPSAMKFDITRLSLSKSSPDHVYVAGLDNELLCGCWSRGALAGGFAFRGCLSFRARSLGACLPVSFSGVLRAHAPLIPRFQNWFPSHFFHLQTFYYHHHM